MNGLGLALFAGAILSAGVVNAGSEAMTLGNSKAPVTVAEYASVGCSHCATWANEVFPAFKAKYIDTGQVRFVLHEMLTGSPDLAAAGFLLAHCAAPEKYFQVVDAIFAQQERIGAEGAAGLTQVGEAAGLTSGQVAACLADHAALDALDARTKQDAEAHGVTGTPTFFVSASPDTKSEKLVGEQSLDELGAAIARVQPRH